MNLPNTIEKILDRVKKEGIGKTAFHTCKTCTQGAITLPVQLVRQYNLKNKLLERIEKVKEELNNHPEQLFWEIRDKTLQYVRANHKANNGPGAYSYKFGGPPILYASCYAALTRHLYNDLGELSDSDRKEWIKYIQSFQTEAGLFCDPVINIPLAEEIDWWGWRHLTLHALMALSVLGGVAQKPFSLLNAFRKPGSIGDWLETRNWERDAASVSNEIQNYATMLQYARGYQGEQWCNDALAEMYRWLDTRQDPEKGYWWYGNQTRQEVSLGVQTGYHLWCLYFYDGRPIQYVEWIIDSCLATQNSLGGFGVSLNSSACEDIDSIDPLVRLCSLIDYRRDDIIKVLEKALPWVIVNVNTDGGWVFRRHEIFQYGHPLMCTEIDESSMFSTWFRILSLAYISKVLPEKPIANIRWKFINCPGFQFWFDSNK